MTRSPAARVRALKRHVWNARLRFEVTCAPGFEALLEAEVTALPGTEVTGRRTGAVAFDAPYDTLHHALLRLRTAEALRIVLIDDAAAATLPMLHDRLSRVDWTLWLPEACRVTLRLHASKSRLRDEASLRDAVAGALRPQGIAATVLGAGEWGDVELRLALHRDRLRLALTVDGQLHHHWGDKWVIPGSLRDSTAAGVVRLAFGASAHPDLILDPFCGAGTLLLEALDHAAGGRTREREVAFANSPAWRAERARQALREVLSRDAATAAALPSIGFDADRAAVDAARHNVALAGFAHAASVSVQDARRIDAAAIAQAEGAQRPLLLSNPPYGKEASAIGDDPDALLARLLSGAAGWRFALLYPRPDAIARCGAAIDAIHPVTTGGLRNAVVLGHVGAPSRDARETAKAFADRPTPQGAGGEARQTQKGGAGGLTLRRRITR